MNNNLKICFGGFLLFFSTITLVNNGADAGSWLSEMLQRHGQPKITNISSERVASYLMTKAQDGSLSLNFSNLGLSWFSPLLIRTARQLKVLDLSCNRLKYFPGLFLSGSNLEILKLNNNLLATLDKSVFIRIRKLRELTTVLYQRPKFFSAYTTVRVHSDEFYRYLLNRRVRNEEKWHCEHDGRVRKGIFLTVYTTVGSIHNNHFKCDHNFLDFINWVTKTKIMVPNLTSLKCHCGGEFTTVIDTSGNVRPLCASLMSTSSRKRREDSNVRPMTKLDSYPALCASVKSTLSRKRREEYVEVKMILDNYPDLSGWSCTTSVILLTANSSNSNTSCFSTCKSNGYSYYSFDRNCSCGESFASSVSVKSSTRSCTFRCTPIIVGSCSFIPYINESLVKSIKGEDSYELSYQRRGIKVKLIHQGVISNLAAQIFFSDRNMIGHSTSVRNVGKSIFTKSSMVSFNSNGSNLYVPLSNNLTFVGLVPSKTFVVSWNFSESLILKENSSYSCPIKIKFYDCMDLTENYTVIFATFLSSTEEISFVRLSVLFGSNFAAFDFETEVLPRVEVVKKVFPVQESRYLVNETLLFLVKANAKESIAYWSYVGAFEGHVELQTCKASCPKQIMNNSICDSSTKDGCFFFTTPAYNETGYHSILVNITNPVTEVPTTQRFDFNIDCPISLSRIQVYCPSAILLHTPTLFTVEKIKGNVLNYTFFVSNIKVQEGQSNKLIYAFDSIGSYRISSTAINAISNATVDLTIQVVENGTISSLMITSPGGKDLETFKNITFKVSLCHDWPATYNWTFDKGWTLMTSKPETTQQFTKIGPYIVTVIGKTDLSVAQTQMKFVLHDKIESFIWYFDYKVIEKGKNLTARVSVNKGNDVTYHLFIDNSLVKDFTTNETSFRLVDLGVHRISIFASNKISSSYKQEVTVDVQEVISVSLRRTWFLSTFSTHTFEAIRNAGSSMRVSWEFGNGKSQIYYAERDLIKVNTSYSAEGYYDLHLFVYNNISNMSLVAKVIAIHTVDMFSITGPQYVLHNSSHEFNISFVMPSIFQRWVMINGKTYAINKTMIFMEQFIQAGNHSIAINASNAIGWTSKTISVHVFYKVDFKLETEHFIAVNKSFTVPVEKFEGSEVQVTWTSSNGLTGEGEIFSILFDNLGDFNITLKAINPVSRKIASILIHVELNITTVSVFQNFSILATHSYGCFQTSVNTRREHKYEWLIDDSVQVTRENLFCIQFISSGFHLIKVQVSNHISSHNSSHQTFEVQEPIEGLSFRYSDSFYGDLIVAGEKVILLSSIRRGDPVMFNWTRDGKALPGGSKTLNFTAGYPGSFYTLVKLVAYNDLSQSTVSRRFPIIAKVTTVSLEATKMAVKVNELVKIQAILRTGTNLSFLWESSDGQVAYGGLFQNFNFSFPGVYSVFLTAFNIVSSSRSQALLLTAQIPVGNINLYPLVARENTSTLFSLSVSSETNVTYYWSISNLSTSFQGLKTRVRFAYPGIFRFTIQALNLVSNETFCFNVTVQRMPEIYRFDTEAKFVRVNQTMDFTTEGNQKDLKYVWSVNGKIHFLTFLDTFRHQFIEPGVYVVGVNVSNFVGFDFRSLLVYVQEPVSEITIYFCCNYVIPTDENTTIQASVLTGTSYTIVWRIIWAGSMQNRTGNVILLKVKSKGNVSIHVSAFNMVSYEGKDFVVQALPRPVNLTLLVSHHLVLLGSNVTFRAYVRAIKHPTYKWYLNGSLLPYISEIIEYNFSALGIYIVTVEVTTLLPNSTLTSSKEINVTIDACKIPAITVLGGKRREITKALSFLAEIKVQNGCAVDLIEYKWMVLIAENSSNCLLSSSILPSYSIRESSPLLNSSSLFFPANFFELGFYCLVCNLKHGSQLQFITAVTIHLTVQRSDLIPVIFGGKSRLSGVEEDLILDGSQSRDPNADGHKSTLLFRWGCNLTLTNAYFNWTYFCYYSKWNKESRKQIPRKALSMGEVILFFLSIKEDSVYKVYTTSQTVTIVPGILPILSVVCLSCPTSQPSTYIQNKETRLSVECQNCMTLAFDGNISYHWSLKSAESKLSLVNISKGNSRLSPVLVLYENSLDVASQYVVSIDVTAGEYSAVSSLLVVPNMPPRNGSCIINPTSGYSLLTMFEFSCFGVQDDDNTLSPIVFIVECLNQFGEVRILLRGIRSKFTTYLPLGDPNNEYRLHVTVLAEDILGATAIQLDTTVMVLEPDISNIEGFLTSQTREVLSKAVNQGHINQAVFLSTCITSLINNSKITKEIRDALSSDVVKFLARLYRPSLLSMSQVALTIFDGLSLSDERDIETSSRQELTGFLSNAVDFIKLASSGNEIGDQTLMNAIVKLILNNVQGYGALLRSARKRRSLATETEPESLTFLRTNLRLRHKLMLAILSSRANGEDTYRISNKYESTSLRRVSSSSTSVYIKDSRCIFNVKTNLVKLSDMYEIFNSTASSPFAWLPNVDGPVCSLSYFFSNGSDVVVRNLTEENRIVVAVSSNNKKREETLSKVLDENSFIVGKINLGNSIDEDESLSISVGFQPTVKNGIVEISVFRAVGQEPSEGNNDTFLVRIIDSREFTIFYLPREFNTSTSNYVGFKNHRNEKVMLSVTTFTTKCMYLNKQMTKWESKGCKPLPISNTQQSFCSCTHLTTFSSSLNIKPNPIDFTVLQDLDIERNPIAVATCLSVLVIYCIALFFAHRKDENDRRQVQFIPYIGEEGYYKYEIRVRTSSLPFAGTSAKVAMRLYGTKGKTKAIKISAPDRLQRNSMDLYRFGTERSLGQVWKIRVWHDNSGSSPSWCLSRVVLKDLLSGQKYFFFCNSWLAVDRGSGAIEQEFYVANEKMMKSFSTIFFDILGRSLGDYHLWLSVMERPKLSRFTRAQRLTCCVTFFMMWMCVNAMWYRNTADSSPDVYFGFKAVTYEEIIVGIITSVIVFPVNMFIVFIFRKTRYHNSRVIDRDETDEITVYPFIPGPRRGSSEYIEIDDVRGTAFQHRSLERSGLRRCNKRITIESHYLMSSLLSVKPELDEEEETTAIRETVSEMDHCSHSNSAKSLINQTLRRISSKSLLNGVTGKGSLQDKNFDSKLAATPLLKQEDDEGGIPDLNQGDPSHQLSCLLDDYITESNSMMHPYQGTSDFRTSRPRSSSLTQGLKISSDFKIPEVRELHSSLNYSLPPWCSFFAYWACLSLSLLSAILTLIFGRQFGKELARKWITSMFVGLFQDIFITYPMAIILVAAMAAIIPRQMNLDSSDLVNCQVIQDSAISSAARVKPLRGSFLRQEQKKGKRKRKIRKTVVLLGFLMVNLWLVTVISMVSHSNYLPIASKEISVLHSHKPNGLHGVSNVQEYWKWVEVTLVPFLFDKSSRPWTLASNPVIRQLRVKLLQCPVKVDKWKTSKKWCRLPFSKTSEDQRSFSLGWSNSTAFSSPGWQYKSDSQINGTIYHGKLANYPKTGYASNLGREMATAVSRLVELKLNGWYDGFTRTIFVQFVLHNANVNKYAVITLTAETSSAGLLISEIEVIYAKFHLYFSNMEYFKLFCEVLFGLLSFYYLWNWITQVRKHGQRAFTQCWKLHQLLMLITALIIVGISIYRLIKYNNLQKHLDKGVPDGYDLRFLAIIENVVEYLYGFMGFLIILKGIKLLKWTNVYTSFSQSMKSFRPMIALLFIVYLITILAFASWLYLVFGPYAEHCSTIWKSFTYTLAFRNRGKEMSETRTVNAGHSIMWCSFLTSIFLFYVFLFRGAMCNEFSDRRIREASRGSSVKFSGSSRRRKSPQKGKRAHFTQSSPFVTMDTNTVSEHTVYIPWDPGFFLDSYVASKCSRGKSVELLTPRAESVLSRVRELEKEEFMAEEIYSLIEATLKKGKRTPKF